MTVILRPTRALALRSTCLGRSLCSSQRASLGCRSRLVARAAQAKAPVMEDDQYAEIDFYSLLGVSPFADEKTIKKAYFTMIKACHPDRTQDDDATDFCALLNEVYETLADPDKRALYDTIAGFSVDSVNPFLDTSFERDQVFVDEVTCIGCRNCNNVCPKTFGMEEDWGRARVMQQGVDADEKLQEAIDTCPVSCIHWVSAPQLSLLEAAMARMERRPVWAGGGKANEDVFTEASLSWTKRQLELQRRAAAAQPQTATTGWAFWDDMVSSEGSTGSRFYRQAGDASARARAEASAGDAATSREGRSIAGLAARAARAARTWKNYQSVASSARRRGLALSTTSSASLSSLDSLGSLDSIDLH